MLYARALMMGSAETASAFGAGKVILFGEHSVVYGHPALAAGINRGVRAAASHASDTERGLLLSIPAWDVELEAAVSSSNKAQAKLREALLVILEEAEAFHPELSSLKNRGVRLHAEVELPPGAGLGCSAALGVALIGALDTLGQKKRSPKERALASLAWERVFHGNPSGIDSMMAAIGGCIRFTRQTQTTDAGNRNVASNMEISSLRLKAPLSLVVANSGEHGSTEAMVRLVAQQREKEAGKIQKIFDGIASIVENAQLAAEANDLKALGQLMDMNQMLLGSLMVSTPKLEELCACARESGALGAKLTGSGGGGCIIALCQNEEDAARIAKELRELATEAFAVRIEESSHYEAN